jgi:hypothetical protein
MDLTDIYRIASSYRIHILHKTYVTLSKTDILEYKESFKKIEIT